MSDLDAIYNDELHLTLEEFKKQALSKGHEFEHFQQGLKEKCENIQKEKSECNFKASKKSCHNIIEKLLHELANKMETKYCGKQKGVSEMSEKDLVTML